MKNNQNLPAFTLRFKVRLLSFILFLSFGVISQSVFSQKPTIGAVRWDAWVGDLNTDGVGAPQVGLQVERSLGPNKYHFKLPFYGVETGTNSVQARETTQAVMTQDITYAKNGGIDYWAFVYYPDNSGMDTARKLYDANPNKNDVKHCYILGASALPTSSWLVSKFAEPNYQKVLGNRPLLYLYDSEAYSASIVANLRSLCAQAGIGSPYITVMSYNEIVSSGGLNALQADAISSYVTVVQEGRPYADLVAQELFNWDNAKATNLQVIPWVTTGWDNRPRFDNPVSWLTVNSDSYVETATAAEVGNHVADGVNWIKNYPASSQANTVLIYAWNEFDEGGWICPTLFNGTDRLDAIKSAIANPRVSRNLALNKTYKSSSNANFNETAFRGFDGFYSTNWQSSNANYAGQWLQVNFGAVTVFDSVRVSEFGNRTSGYRIEYSTDGTTWQTAYTGTTIGTSKVISFPSVSGNYARIYFTGGSNSAIIYEFEVYKGSGNQPVVPSGNANLALNRTYGSSSNYDATQTPGKACDANGGTNWQAGGNTTYNGQWLQVNFGASTSFNSVTISEYGDRTSGYRIEYSTNGTTWQTAYTGTTIGANKTVNFAAVTGNYARLYFTGGNATPIIYEFEIYQNQVTANANLALNRTYGSSSNYDANQTAGKACDASTSTNWQAGSNTSYNGQWLQVNFGASTSFNSVTISEYGDRTSGYRIEYSTNGTTWQTAYTGTTLGANKTVDFPAVTGNYARLYFTGGNATPIIYEFEIYQRPVTVTVNANLALNRTYGSSSNYDANQTSGKACDASASTNWQASSSSIYNGQWLQVNFGASTTFNSVTISEYGDRTSGYRIEYSTNGTTWQTAYTGTTLGANKTVNFPAVTGNYARLYFTGGIATPIIYEFEIYNTASATRIAAEGSDERFGFEVYPNPSGDVVNVSYNLPPNSEAELSVFDMMGKTIKQINFTSANDTSGKISVDVSRFKSGVYFINIDSDGKSFAKKVIVEK